MMQFSDNGEKELMTDGGILIENNKFSININKVSYSEFDYRSHAITMLAGCSMCAILKVIKELPEEKDIPCSNDLWKDENSIADVLLDTKAIDKIAKLINKNLIKISSGF